MATKNLNLLPRIPEFFQNKRVFLTGGTGFIGKVFIEKLLRSCPDVDRIYLLMRSKKGKSVEQRIKEMTDLPLFDLLRNERPEQFKKIKIIVGDATQLGLGLNEEDRQILINEIDLIYHVAASVRFDHTLTEAVILNTRGTREACKLALEMKRLKCFIYISTAYCNSDHQVLEEKIYPPHGDWRKTIELAEKLDEKTFNVLTEKYMDPLPNTYIFAKHLAEHVVNDLLLGNVPIVIARPSIVISTYFDPFPGWIDNFNGPVGLLAASGKGIVRTMYQNPDILADYIPVDTIVRGMLMIPWDKCHAEDPLAECSIYNGSNNEFQTLTFREVTELGKKLQEEIPLAGSLWTPGGAPTSCWYNYFFRFMILQLIPAVVIDMILKVTGHKPLLVKIQRRIYSANLALEYFITNQWTFTNKNSIKLEESLLPEDVEDFGLRKEQADPYEYFRQATIGLKRYLLKEFDDENAKKHYRRMYMLDKFVLVIRYLFIFWLVFLKIDIIGLIVGKYHDAYIYLTTP